MAKRVRVVLGDHPLEAQILLGETNLCEVLRITRLKVDVTHDEQVAILELGYSGVELEAEPKISTADLALLADACGYRLVKK